ncbi:MAG TPA: hypothetical protein VET26_04905 [Candidatus Sulfotelmatobacter sp.]|nr:hypothetical protein [Candidatus Sulfotelmatobacter sp.]
MDLTVLLVGVVVMTAVAVSVGAFLFWITIRNHRRDRSIRA